MGLKRGRATGRLEQGRHFGFVYDDILRSSAWTSLPHFARSVCLAIAAQYRGSNNGDLDLTVRKAAEYGISHKELAAALPLLEVTGLVHRTRQGRLACGAKVCSLYELTFRPLDPSDKYDQPVSVQQPTKNTWAKWEKPNNWSIQVKQAKQRAAGRKFQTPHVGSEPLPHVGTENGSFQSTRAERLSANSNPHGRYSSKNLGVPLREEVEGLIGAQPHLSDVDVAVTFHWKVNQFDVAHIRQDLERRTSSTANGA